MTSHFIKIILYFRFSANTPDFIHRIYDDCEPELFRIKSLKFFGKPLKQIIEGL